MDTFEGSFRETIAVKMFFCEQCPLEHFFEYFFFSKYLGFKGLHTQLAPEGREGRYQAGPKGRNLKVGARRAPRLLIYMFFII